MNIVLWINILFSSFEMDVAKPASAVAVQSAKVGLTKTANRDN